MINGSRERIVMDQIQNALKVVTDRMSQKSSRNFEEYDDNRSDMNQDRE